MIKMLTHKLTYACIRIYTWLHFQLILTHNDDNNDNFGNDINDKDDDNDDIHVYNWLHFQLIFTHNPGSYLDNNDT
jgi:hypothetical protein